MAKKGSHKSKGPTLTDRQATLAVEIRQMRKMKILNINGWSLIEAMHEHVLKNIEENPGLDPCLLLFEAYEMVMRERGAGVICPACTQNAKIYARPVTTEMVRCLAKTVQKCMKTGSWIYGREFKERGGDYGKLRYWGLIEFEQREPGSKRPKGAPPGRGIRPTRLGVLFLLDKVRIPRHALIYDRKFLAFKDQSDTISVRDVKRFDWEEVMQTVRGADKLPWT